MRALAVVLLLVAGFSRVDARSRPAGVPHEAVWVGGADGGVWIHCSKVVYSPDRFRCVVYFDSTGERWAAGNYLLRRATWNRHMQRTEYSRPTEFPSKLRFSSFDGSKIILRDSLVLIPGRPRR